MNSGAEWRGVGNTLPQNRETSRRDKRRLGGRYKKKGEEERRRQTEAPLRRKEAQNPFL